MSSAIMSTVASLPLLFVSINTSLALLGRVHTRLFRTGRDRSRPVRAQLPVSTRGKLECSFRILETTSRHGTSGRDRSRSVAPCQIYRVDARVGATDLSANQPLLAHAFLIYFFPFWAHVRFHVSSIDCVMLKPIRKR